MIYLCRRYRLRQENSHTHAMTAYQLLGEMSKSAARGSRIVGALQDLVSKAKHGDNVASARLNALHYTGRASSKGPLDSTHSTRYNMANMLKNGPNANVIATITGKAPGNPMAREIASDVVDDFARPVGRILSSEPITPWNNNGPQKLDNLVSYLKRRLVKGHDVVKKRNVPPV